MRNLIKTTIVPTHINYSLIIGNKWRLLKWFSIKNAFRQIRSPLIKNEGTTYLIQVILPRDSSLKQSKSVFIAATHDRLYTLILLPPSLTLVEQTLMIYLLQGKITNVS